MQILLNNKKCNVKVAKKHKKQGRGASPKSSPEGKDLLHRECLSHTKYTHTKRQVAALLLPLFFDRRT